MKVKIVTKFVIALALIFYGLVSGTNGVAKEPDFNTTVNWIANFINNYGGGMDRHPLGDAFITYDAQISGAKLLVNESIRWRTVRGGKKCRKNCIDEERYELELRSVRVPKWLKPTNYKDNCSTPDFQGAVKHTVEGSTKRYAPDKRWMSIYFCGGNKQANAQKLMKAFRHLAKLNEKEGAGGAFDTNLFDAK